jgi:hypothetical protein
MAKILFLEDWKRYPNAVVDDRTTNTSYLELASLLKRMGVKNYFFMLALHDRGLLGIDPHDPDLSPDIMSRILIECKLNYWYAARNVWKAPAKAGTQNKPVGANRANLSMWWSFFNHITYVLTQPRQTGKTFGVGILGNSLMNFHCDNSQINLLTKDDVLRTDTIRNWKDIYEELPVYLNFKTKQDANNTEAVTVNRFGNSFLTHVPQSSEKRAANVGRGLSTPVFLLDEPAFQVFIEKSMPAALASMGALREIARENNSPYGIIATTTAGRKDDRSGQFFYSYAMAAAAWSECFYDAKNLPDLEEMVRKNSRGTKDPQGRRVSVSRIYANFSHRQLGKSDAWLMEQIQETGGTPEELNRDYFGVWTSGNDASPLPLEVLEKIKGNMRSDDFSERVGANYILYWNIQRHEEAIYRNKQIIVGIDPSDGQGGDDISFVATCVETGKVLATATIGETNLVYFAQWLVEFLVKYPKSVMVIERKSSGVAIIDHLLDLLPSRGIDPFKRLFNWIMSDPVTYRSLYDEATRPMRHRNKDIYVMAKKYFGFATSSGGRSSRDELYGNAFQNACKRFAEKINNRKLCEQISSLIVDKNGRIDHPPGGHDDLVIGFNLTHWFLQSARGLANYGISPTDVYCLAKEDKVNQSPREKWREIEQLNFRARIREITQEVQATRDPHILFRKEVELAVLQKKLVVEDGEVLNIETLLEQIKEKKTTMKQQRTYHV